MTHPPRRPAREELRPAAGRTVPEVIAPDLRVLFCGINPGLYCVFPRALMVQVAMLAPSRGTE